MSKTEIEMLAEQLKSDDWKTSLAAADRLGEIGTDESVKPLLDSLGSSNNFLRNAASLGLMGTQPPENQKYFQPLMNRIVELGCEEEIGTMVYALQIFDCSRNLFDIVNIYLRGNYEQMSGAQEILNEQKFILKKDEVKAVADLLEEFNYSLEGFKLSYEIIE